MPFEKLKSLMSAKPGRCIERPKSATRAKLACLMAIAPFILAPEIAPGAPNVNGSNGAELRQRLEHPVDILWSGVSLRAGLEGLAESQHVAIVIDRRVDPGRELKVALHDTPLGSALQIIADGFQLGITRFGSVVFIGPTAGAKRLCPLAAAREKGIRQLSAPVQGVFLAKKAMAWPDLSTPRALIEQLAEENGLEIVGLERVPHDLWAAADLPPLRLIDRLTLILVQFDLTFEVSTDGKQITLMPIPDNVPEAVESVKPANSKAAATTSSSGRGDVTIGAVRIQRLTIQSEPLGSVLRQLAGRLGLILEIDEKAVQAAGISLDQGISFRVQNVTVDELFEQLLRNTGLRYRRHEKQIAIAPAP
jgi:hypothetical protein